MAKIYELQPKNNQKSFYGKALVKVYDDGTEVLFSYGVLIMARKNGVLSRFWDGTIEGTDKWSATTGKHIKAFCGLNKSEYLDLPYDLFYWANDNDKPHLYE